ncbi:hypothetical protein [Lysinibacillus halotolerans]|uniref:Bacterial EndoU nuclease domain-containing protein n=1 Tax=Lysinibacillus halotolerans TaxID=1368476 RepID=A0A3M8HFF5_9BACI|nr:hypothetical protein [Lysinibacillus halotolerans]RND01089.1 hypothetical protein EC501_02180 [Lysinibacillus halotolerans]
MIWFTLILLILNAVLVPLSTVAQALDAESDKIILENEKSENSSSLSSDDLNIFPSTIIKETENEKIYRLSIGHEEYEYHEKYSIENNIKLIKTTSYLVNTEGEKEFIDYFERQEELELHSPITLEDNFVPDEAIRKDEYQIMCGPPCGYIAVIAVRALVSGTYRYYLKRTATSATLATVTSQPVSRVAPVIANYSPRVFSAGGRSYKITKQDMQHFLQRHHMNYWNAGIRAPQNGQTFFVKNMSTRTLDHIASQAVQRNATAISTARSKGWSFTNQITYTYNGITYRVGVDLVNNRVTQLYPLTTYIAP